MAQDAAYDADVAEQEMTLLGEQRTARNEAEGETEGQFTNDGVPDETDPLLDEVPEQTFEPSNEIPNKGEIEKPSPEYEYEMKDMSKSASETGGAAEGEAGTDVASELTEKAAADEAGRVAEKAAADAAADAAEAAAESAAEAAGEAAGEAAAEAAVEAAATAAAETAAEVAAATLGESIVAAAGASAGAVAVGLSWLGPVGLAIGAGYAAYEIIDAALEYDKAMRESGEVDYVPPLTLDEILEQSRAEKRPDMPEWKNSEADEAPQYDAYWAPYGTKGREANTPGDAHWDQSVLAVAPDGTVTYGAHSYVPGAKNFDAATAVPQATQAVANDADAPDE
jgi:hypothetical protein